MWIFLGIIQFSLALLVKAGGGGGGGGGGHPLFCLNEQCFHDDVCRLYNTNGHLSGQCFLKHNVPNKADHDGCPQLLGEGSECFCNNHNCGHPTQAATGQQTITSTNQNDLVCGDHVCHGHQYCIVEDFDKLHLRCADVHNTQYCLPNLLSLGSSCFCDTRTCVDHTLISIFAGHQVAGLICSDHDDKSCHADKVCGLHTDKNGVLKKHCIDVKHESLCTRLPDVGEKCYCITQECVFGEFNAPTTMSTTSKLTTAGPTVAASTTIPPTTVQPTTVQPTTVQPTTVQPTTMQPTTAQPNTSVATTGISSITVASTNTPMVQAASSIPTTTVAVTSSSNNTCTDDEDINFSCVVYEMMYGLCNATAGTLFNIAQKRCQAFCGICAGNNTSGTTPASLPTQPTCIDHDARCSQYQKQICSATVSQNYVISTCPKSCNKCAEYLASLNPVTTPTPIKCNTCGDISNGIPCYSKDVYGNSSTTICPTGYNYCMTDVLNDGNGNSDVFKRCVTQQTCDTKWLKESADQDYCMRYGVVTNANAFECHFCCSGDQCNSGIKPATSTLLAKTSG